MVILAAQPCLHLISLLVLVLRFTASFTSIGTLVLALYSASPTGYYFTLKRPSEINVSSFASLL